MCIFVILKDDFGFYYFQRRETTKSKEDTSNSKHATPRIYKKFKYSMGWHCFIDVLFKKLLLLWHLSLN